MSLLKDMKNLLKKNEDFSAESGDVDTSDEKFVEVKTTEDIILRVDGELEEGKSIEVIDESGASVAPNGEHELEDGTMIVVEEGSIASITSPEPEPENEGEPTPDEGEGEDMEDADNENMENDDKKKEDEEDMEKSDESFSKEEIKETFNLLINEMKDLKSSYDEIKEEMNTMNEDFSKFKKDPSSDSIKDEKNTKEWGTLYEKFGKYRK